MGKLNAEQVKQLADNFLLMTNALGNYRYENYQKLDEEENERLKELHYETLMYITELYTKAAVLVLDDVKEVLEHVQTITSKTKILYDKLTNVQKVIDRAIGIAGLAAAFISLDTDDISTSIQELLLAED